MDRFLCPSWNSVTNDLSCSAAVVIWVGGDGFILDESLVQWIVGAVSGFLASRRGLDSSVKNRRSSCSSDLFPAIFLCMWGGVEREWSECFFFRAFMSRLYFEMIRLHKVDCWLRNDCFLEARDEWSGGGRESIASHGVSCWLAVCNTNLRSRLMPRCLWELRLDSEELYWKLQSCSPLFHFVNFALHPNDAGRHVWIFGRCGRHLVLSQAKMERWLMEVLRRSLCYAC